MRPYRIKSILRLLNRAVNIRTLIVYMSAILILWLLNDGICFERVFGGLTSEISYVLPFEKIMEWNICILPPAAVGILFFHEELGRLGIFTAIRSGSVKRWWRQRLSVIIVSEMTYVIMIIVSDMIWCSDNHKLAEYVVFFAVFYIHIFLVTIAVAGIYAVSHSHRISIVFYCIVEIFLTSLGCVSIKLSDMLIPFWGMINYRNKIDIDNMKYRLLTCGISILLSVIIIKFVTVQSKADFHIKE